MNSVNTQRKSKSSPLKISAGAVKKIALVYSEDCKKHINKRCSATGCLRG
jgi:hypothetical protein